MFWYHREGFQKYCNTFPLWDPAMLVALLRWDLPKNVFPPRILIFVGSSLIHRDFSVSCAPVAAELSGGANMSHVCCKNSVFCKCVQADIHQHLQSAFGGSDLNIDDDILSHLIFTLPQSVPLIPAWMERWTPFHKPSEREQKLVRLNMQQAACRRHAISKI